ncbi:penicillin-binding transpeptidase domain-containing protein [Jatrophihabitans sp. YIM 134969]
MPRPPALRRSAGVLAATVVLVSTLVACTSDDRPDRDAAQEFLDAYAARNAADAGLATDDPTAAKTALAATLAAMPGATPTFTVTGSTKDPKTTSTVDYRASWKFAGVTRTWDYTGTLTVQAGGKDDDPWKVRWTTTDVAPAVTQAGQYLATTRTAPTRGGLLDSDGTPLFTQQEVVTVGIDRTQAGDLGTLAAQLAAVPQLQTTAAQIIADAEATPTGQLVTVVTLRRAVYDQVKARIYDLPGVQFPSSTALLGPTSTFAQPLLGRVGPATADQVQASKGAITAGDVVGQGGLQEALNATLGGTPGLSVDLRDSTDRKVRSVATVAGPAAGKDVTLTLDRAVQTAAENTLADVALPATIVVTRPSTGAVLAVANNAAAAAQGDLALTGQFPPGSTFKIATYTGVFSQLSGITPDTPVDCPATTTVNGQTVRNEDEFTKGTIPVAQAFAFSCNTSAAAFALKLPAGGLARAAASLGLGQKWELPVDAFSGSMPNDAQSNELAAEGYGQGQVLVSPLLMAEMAGGAATGTAVAPSLVAGTPGQKLATASPAVTAAMNTLMRDVVTVPGATGRGLADLPGEVEGKTGTAEYGTDDPPKAHSWFAGVRGDLAFSVFVLGGERSTDTSVPISRTLLQALPQ